MAPNSRIVHESIQALLAEAGSFAPRELAARTGLTRQALQRHLAREVEAGRLERTGRGRAVRYRRPGGRLFDRTYATSGLDESAVWSDVLEALKKSVPGRSQEVDEILGYAVTEVVNNAIDHSGARQVDLAAEQSEGSIVVRIGDAGIGAFESVRARLHVEDHLHALQEISKGKTTTDPERHTGEGLFFASKAVDRFELHANGLVWHVDNLLPDQAISEEPVRPGTRVNLRIDPGSRRSLRRVFEAHTTGLAFDRTRAVVRLFEYGTRFVSRSEAKRLTSGLERFREVILDFRGVEGVGQGFVDELFRVWAIAHPEVRLVPVDMNEAVEFMVRRGLADRDSE